jgi:hypothetical protein
MSALWSTPFLYFVNGGHKDDVVVSFYINFNRVLLYRQTTNIYFVIVGVCWMRVQLGSVNAGTSCIDLLRLNKEKSLTELVRSMTEHRRSVDRMRTPIQAIELCRNSISPRIWELRKMHCLLGCCAVHSGRSLPRFQRFLEAACNSETSVHGGLYGATRTRNLTLCRL